MIFDEVIDRRKTDSLKWRTCSEDVIPLSVADMDFRSPEPIALALEGYAKERIFGYALAAERDSHGEIAPVVGLLVDRMLRRYSWRISEDDVCIVPGVVAALNAACRVMARDNCTKAIVLPPVYPPILAAPTNAQLRAIEAPLIHHSDGSYGICWDALGLHLRQRGGLLLLCNPHNPVGRVYGRNELERLAKLCVSAGVVVCSDEVHSDIVFDQRKHTPIASLNQDIAELCITLVSPSKSFNLSGLQCAFAIIQNQSLRTRFMEMMRCVVPGTNAAGLVAATAAYRAGDLWLEQMLSYVAGNRSFLDQFVRDELPRIGFTMPEGTYLAWLDLRRYEMPNPYQFLLDSGRVQLMDGRIFGREGSGFVRLNFACPRSVLAEALSRIKDCF